MLRLKELVVNESATNEQFSIVMSLPPSIFSADIWEEGAVDGYCKRTDRLRIVTFWELLRNKTWPTVLPLVKSTSSPFPVDDWMVSPWIEPL